MSEHFLANADISGVVGAGLSGRFSWEKIAPRVGDLARVVKDVTLESGGLLPENQNVLIEHVTDEAPSVVGVKWHDKDGTHVMALEVSKLEVAGSALRADAESLTEGGAMQPDSIAGKMTITQTEERQSIIKEFEWSITDLQKVVEELQVRLSPVTRNEPSALIGGDIIEPSSEVRGRLHDLQNTTASLRSLLSRLEV